MSLRVGTHYEPRVERLNGFGYPDSNGEFVRLVVWFNGTVRFIPVDAMARPADNMRLAEAIAQRLTRNEHSATEEEA